MKHHRNNSKLNKKIIAMLSVFIMLAMVAIGRSVSGTVAWLVSKSESKVSTFTLGDINITLAESDFGSQSIKIIPGIDIKKDPKVTVMANSEACWLFVKVEERNWPEFKEADGTTRKVSYSVNNGWNALEKNPGVYYREVSAEEAQKGIDYTVLAGNENCLSGVIKVSQELTKAEINSIIFSGNQPSLTFTAYAVQRAGIDTADAAWTTVNP